MSYIFLPSSMLSKVWVVHKAKIRSPEKVAYSLKHWRIFHRIARENLLLEFQATLITLASVDFSYSQVGALV